MSHCLLITTMDRYSIIPMYLILFSPKHLCRDGRDRQCAENQISEVMVFWLAFDENVQRRLEVVGFVCGAVAVAVWIRRFGRRVGGGR
jgi:hypothetical protein